MAAQLQDSGTLFPPSQLSMFGVNFVMKAVWLVTIDDTASDELRLHHQINYFSASHVLVGSGNAATVQVFLDQKPTVLNDVNGQPLSTTIDLPLMALDPLAFQSKTAIMGFIRNTFVILPMRATTFAAPVPFKAISSANNLVIVDSTDYFRPSVPGSGFGFLPGETALTTFFTENCSVLSMTLYFKVVDTKYNYTLFLKHWKASVAGVMLVFTINGDTDNAITRYVDAREGEGGENNLLSVALRDQNYASIDFHDYLQLGLNSIRIAISPIDGGALADCHYQVRAISIEKV
jgi:hypothetical protein